MFAPSTINVAIKRLNAFVKLAEDDEKLLHRAELRPHHHPVGGDLREGGRHILLLDGWACRCRILPDGHRQICSFFVPGDSVDLSSTDLFLTEALTRAETVDVGDLLPPLTHSLAAHSRLRAALSDADRADHRRQLDHMVRLGSMSAHDAAVDLLMEFHDRLRIVGLAKGGCFPLPLFQDILGTALGLSPAHTSRVFSQLRREGRFELRSGWVHSLDAPTNVDEADRTAARSMAGLARARMVRQLKQRASRLSPEMDGGGWEREAATTASCATPAA